MEFYNLVKDDDLNIISPKLLLPEIEILQKIESSSGWIHRCVIEKRTIFETVFFIGDNKNNIVKGMYVLLLQKRGLLKILNVSYRKATPFSSIRRAKETAIYRKPVRSKYKEWPQLNELRVQIAVGVIGND